MFDNYFRKDIAWGGQMLTLETGKIARQADGAVMARLGDTIVLCTVVGARNVKPGQDFFPLTVNYQEKAFAAGKIPGGFFKREGRPSEIETLICRLIDRPLRPLFPEGFRNEVQVIATVMSHDGENDPDIVALVGCSAALTISGIPFFGPVGAARVGYIDGQYVLNPTAPQRKLSQLDLVVAGTAEGVLMVESEAQELSEDIMLGAVEYGHKHFQPVIEGIIALAEVAAKEPWNVVEAGPCQGRPQDPHRRARHRADGRGLQGDAEAHPPGQGERGQEGRAGRAGGRGRRPRRRPWLMKELEADVVRGAILDTGLRIDGRDTRTVRPIMSEVGVLPRAHGSALFTRGETQAFCVATLGTGQDEQIIDALGGEFRENFMLHYNFPPYSVARRPHGLPGPARDRPRQAGLAGDPSRAAGEGQVPLHHARGVRDHGKQRLVLDGDGLRHLPRADGCGLPAAAPGGRHRHGPHQGGPRLRRAVRHPGRRGPPRRHGLQGGRHGGGHHLPPDGHQDHLHHLEIMRQALEQARDGRLHILGEMAKGLTGRRGDVAGHRAAHHRHRRAEGEDPRRASARRQGDPRDHGADRHQGGHRGRRHDQGARHLPKPRRGRSTGSAASWPSRRSA
jgi:polyribonucleotide nucleotidyltransferase